jgi:MFS family permease
MMDDTGKSDISCFGDVEKGLEPCVVDDSAVESRASPSTSPSEENTDQSSERKSNKLKKIHRVLNLKVISRSWELVTRKSNSDGLIDTNPPPDGGVKAWTVVVMCHMAGFNTWGFLNSFGVLQSYYVSHLSHSPSDISWIGSIQAFLLFFISAFSGRLSDAGYFHQTLFVGTTLQILGIFSASFAKNYWQLLLSQGVCVGIGGGLVFIPALSLVGTYFSKRQSLALSVCACGNSMGGLFYAAILQNVLPRLGLAWALRVIGFVFVVTMIPANFLLRPRRIKRSTGPIVEWAAFKEPAYAFFAGGMFFCMVGMWVPVFYVSFTVLFEWSLVLNKRSLDPLARI